ncbi:MAG: cyclic pyranopterin monophosphate synthase MoaC [Clostridiales bacterium]|nr:cyclic pyranopterin monophosphate synthase MoaC [Anaerovoracaceae bacterium]PWL95007.1 MAG: cyclic pyranopterin monophosphate synthase MoaC [Clostridiales bacterium]
MGFSHLDIDGRAIMVDVTEKTDTFRMAEAKGSIRVNGEVFEAIKKGESSKGDILAVATTAGIMAAKKTWELIPMCHQIPIGSCSITFEFSDDERVISCICKVKTLGKTGAEMEALTGVSTSLLTVYDMCKSMDKFMEITDIHLVKKTGGKSGTIINERYGDV